MRKLIKAAFDLKSDAQVVGGPEWVNKRPIRYFSEDQRRRYGGIEARARARQGQRIQVMLQMLLSERFNLRVKSAEKELPIFALVVSGANVKLAPDSTENRSLSIHNGHLIAAATSTDELAESLTRMR